MSIFGYDPARVTLLRARTIGAIDALAGLHSSDPEASHALRVARLLRQNLEDTWLPAVDDIVSSTAMCTWRRNAGLTEDAMVRRLGRLVERFDTMSGTTDRARATSLLNGAIDGLLDALRGNGDIGRAHDRLIATALVLTDRADRDPTLAAWLAGLIGADDRWFEAIGRLDEIVRRGLAPDHVSALHPATFVLAIGGGWWSATPERIEFLAHWATRTPIWAEALLDAPWSVDLSVVVGVTRALVLHTSHTSDATMPPRVSDTAERTDALLRLVAGAPAAAAMLLADPGVLAAVATSPRLDPDAVEAVVAAALGGPPMDGSTAHRDQLELLAELVRLTPPGSMAEGAARGLARSVGPFLDELGIHLDTRRPVVIPVGDEQVVLGTYEELAALLGGVLDDPAAQATLGLVLAAHRSEQRDAAVRALREDPARSPTAAVAVMAGHLADTTRILHLVDTAREDRDELHALRFAMARARTDELLGMVGLIPAVGPARAVPLTRQLTTVSTRAVAKAVHAAGPERVPDVGLDRDLAVDFTVVALEAPTRDPVVRRALGLDPVPIERWTEIDSLLDAIASEPDPDERDQLHARVLAVVAGSPDLDAYLETVRSIAGDAGLGG